ncbi:MAG: acetyl-CoA carboxylase biotin carboxyl carrier protein [Elusimicrobia bacterium]|nr:acetyl-CoA carboxylase biotin carboxyl carrier protein [Elusimicrobiota bacterium]
MSKQEKSNVSKEKEQSATELGAKVKAIYDVMCEEKIEELQVSSDDLNVLIKRASKNPVVVAAAPQQVAVAAEANEAAATENSVSAAPAAGETIDSPVSGILWRSPSPTSAPFIKDGDIVNVGQVLCIIEAMKVMNEIKAEFKFKVVKILIDNGNTVNSGDTILSIERI